MNGLREIRAANRAATDLPQTKRENDYRVQRDRLAQVLRDVVKAAQSGPVSMAETAAKKVLVEIYGE